MRAVFLGVLTVVLPVVSGSYGYAAGKKKSRTVKELIEFAQKNGDEGTLPARLLRPIGFEQEMRSKSITYTDKGTLSHNFYLIYRDSSPVALLWIRHSVDFPAEKRTSHFSIFRSSIDGTLESASITSGDFSQRELSSTPINTSTKTEFKKEKRFFLETAVSLPINK